MKKIMFLVLFFHISIQAQEQLFFDREFSYSLNFSHSTLPDSSENHTILKIIGKNLNKSPFYVSFTLNGLIQHKIYRIDTTYYRLQLTLKNFSWSGDIFYRRIALSPVLLPAKTKFKIFFSTKQHTDLTELFPHKQTNIDQMGYVVLLDTLLLQKTTPDISFIKSDSFLFFYDTVSVNKMESFIKLIDDYYLSYKQLVQMDSLLQTLYLDSLEMLPLYDIELKYLSKQVKEIHQKDFFNKLRLWENDPLVLNEKLNGLSQSLTEKQGMVARKLSNYELLLYNKALNEFSVQEKRGIDNFKKILVFNPSFTPALLRLSEYWINKNNTDSAFYYFKKLLNLAIPDSLESLTKTTGQRLYQLITQNASLAIVEQDYVTALALLSRDSILCLHPAHSFCDETWQKLVAKAHYGIYQSFLTVAGKAMTSRKNTIAYHILKQAWNYQKTFSNYILTNIEVKNQFEVVRNNLLSEIQDEIKKKQFSSAEYKFSLVDSIIRLYTEPDTNSFKDWDKTIFQLRIYFHLERVNHLYQNGKNFMADSMLSLIYPMLSDINYLTDTLLIENFKKIARKRLSNIVTTLSSPQTSSKVQRKLLLEFNLLQNYADTSFILSTSLPQVSKRLLIQELIFFENRLNNADSLVVDENYLSYLDSLATESQDFQLAEEKKNLFIKYHEKKCKFFASPQKLHLDSLHYFFSTHSFYKATLFLQNIPAHLEREKCSSYVAYWKNKTDSIVKVFLFFEFLMKEEQNLLQNMNPSSWNGFFQQYLQTESDLRKLHLDTLGITLKTLPVWVAEKKDYVLLGQAFQFFIDTDNYLSALQLLKEAGRQDTPLRYTRKYQKKLGERMAAHDILTGVTDYKKQCLTYTRGDSSLKHFRKSYMKVWKTH